MKKRLLSAVLAVCMIFGSAAMLPEDTFSDMDTSITVSAYEEKNKGDYKYYVNDDGTITITEYTGKNAIVNLVQDFKGKTITSIASGAFSGNTHIKNIIFPATLTKIGYSAFEDCTKLASVEIPGKVTEIEQQAFYGCKSLKTVKLQKGVKVIGWEAFCGCEKLANLDLGSVTNIVTGAFYGCRNLTKITIPDSVTSIGDKGTINIGGAFEGCTSLKTVVLGKGVTYIGPRAFCDCTSLSKAALTSNIEKIAGYAFENTAITEVTIPAKTTYIGERAFLGCEKLKKLTINTGAKKTIGESAFKNDSALATINWGKSVTLISSGAFNSCNSITNVTIPDSVEKLEGGSIYGDAGPFSYCKNLKTVKIGNNVSVIGHYSFVGCTALTDVTFGVNVETIEYNAFENCTSLKRVVLMPNTTTIDSEAFKNCTSLTSVIMPGVATIGESAFDSCENLSSAVISEDIVSIGRYAFAGCPKLKNAYIPENASEFGDHSFGYTSWPPKKIDGFAIHGVKGSDAETYAKDNNIKFVAVKSSHKHDNVQITVPKSCTTDGYKLNICKICGETSIVKGSTVKASHTWGDWKTTKKATCSAKGSKTRTCSVCGKTETQSIKTTAHKYSAWTTTSFNVDKGTSTQKHTCSVCKKTVTRTVNNAVTRFAGANRYDTAAKLSKSSYNTSDTVIIADAMTFQDALIAVPLASAYNAPLLLANPNTITTQTEAELKRLKAKKVIIVNTANALKSNTINALKKYNPTIISGKNCFETSKKVAEALQAKIKTNTKGKTTAPTDVFFTTNKAFADALSVSPVAALKGAPILYVDPSKKTLDSNITAYLNKVKGSVKNVYIVGGLNAIPKALENSIKSALPKKNYKRFDGAQRYETCIMINEYFASILSSKTVCVAKGLNFPDALAGGFFAAKQKAPLILADNALKDAHKNYLKKKAIDKLYIFGGTVAVPDKLAKEIAKASV